MANLSEVFGAIATEGVGFLKTAGVTTGRAALAAYLKKRADDARDILFDELRSGNIAPEQVAAEDDGIAVLYGFMRAAWEGRARLNLRLLAKGISGQLQRGNLVADEFFLHADALASLSRDEIIFIATLIRVYRQEENADRRWGLVTVELRKIWPEDRTRSVAGRSTRSGFVVPSSAFGGLVYSVSPMLLDLCKTVDFDDALRREP